MLVFIALSLGGLCLLLVIILIVIIRITRLQITTLHITIKQIKDGYAYPIPMTTVPPAAGSTSSDDSGVAADPFGSTNRPAQPSRQNTYVDETQNNNNNPYEKLSPRRSSTHSYEDTKGMSNKSKAYA